MVARMEWRNLPADIAGTANPKSTTGRLDVFTRLIPDYAEEFEEVKKGYKGQLYAEVSPRTFSVRVHKGLSLNQLRLRRGAPPPPRAGLRAASPSAGPVDSGAQQEATATPRRR